MKLEWQAILAELRHQVRAEMKNVSVTDQEEHAALARDYRSFTRMEHAPRQARQLAEQIAFQQRWYLDEAKMDDLGLAVTEMLADIYEEGLQSGQ